MKNIRKIVHKRQQQMKMNGAEIRRIFLKIKRKFSVYKFDGALQRIRFQDFSHSESRVNKQQEMLAICARVMRLHYNKLCAIRENPKKSRAHSSKCFYQQ